jgi:hypothetical protein
MRDNMTPRFALIPLLALLSAATASAQTRTADTATRKVAAAKPKRSPVVTRVVAIVRPVSYSGKCPATLHWSATLTVRNPPATVQYEWLRSDSAKGPTKEIVVRGTSATVGGESWQLGADKDRIHVWERLHVISPNTVNSRAAGVNVTCR